jgi:hypothetical protein
MQQLRLATANLFNLAAAGQPYHPGCAYDAVAYERKVAWLARRFGELDADVLGVQECFDEAALALVARRAETAEGRAVYPSGSSVIAEGGAPGAPACGLVTRLPLLGYRYHAEIPAVARLDPSVTHFSRPVLVAEVLARRPDGAPEPLTYVVTHLKSKRPDFRPHEDPDDPLIQARASLRSLALRGCEALGLRAIVLDALAADNDQRSVVLVGDLNDGPEAVTTQTIAGESRLHRRGHESEAEFRARQARSWRSRLYAAWDVQLRRSYRDVYFTHLHEGRHETLDHVLVSEEFHEGNPRRRWQVAAVEVYNDQLGAWGEAPPWASDHGSVVAICQAR